MLTKLGKELRKIRVDMGITLYGMARAAGMSTAMLSAVETGRKAAPDNFIDKLAEAHPEVAAQRETLQKLAVLTKKEIRIHLDEREDATKLAVAFARRFNELSADQITEIQAVLTRDE